MSHLIWNDLVSYGLQVGILVAIAGCVPALLRLRQPKARLLFWRLALAAVLLLPAIRPWRSEVVTAEVHVTTGALVLVTGQASHSSAPIPWTRIALGAIALGIGIRIVLLCAGFWKLSRYRRRSTPLAGAPVWSNVSIRTSAEIEGPVTFGFFRPVILLPERFPTLDAATRDAILHHEMLHVARHDWPFTVAEELVRAALWFHPAIWWLLGEIQLTREQAVDLEVVEATNATEQYVDALLAIARADTGIELAPAFLRRRQLKQRVVSILQEARMPKQKISRSRSLATMALAASLLAGACWVVTGAFPLRAQAHSVMDDAGVSVDTMGAALQHRSSVTYPQAIRDKRIEGTVVAQVKLGETGAVTDAQIVSGPEELHSAVLRSILDWHFSRDLANSTRQVAVTFRSAQTNGAPTALPPRQAALVQEREQALARFQVAALFFQDGLLTDEQQAHLTSIAPIGTPYSNEVRDRFAAAVHDIDEHYAVNLGMRGESGIALSVVLRPAPPPPPRAPLTFRTYTDATAPRATTPVTSIGGAGGTSSASSTTGGPLVVGGRVQSAKLIVHDDPVYPQIAKTARIQGKVILDVVIGVDGAVENATVVQGPPMLLHAAMEAVKSWVYQPTYLNGQPVAVQTTVEVNFTLSN